MAKLTLYILSLYLILSTTANDRILQEEKIDSDSTNKEKKDKKKDSH